MATALHATPRGTLRVHTSMNVVRFLTPIVAEYLTLYPAVSVDLTVGEQMVDLLEGGYDLVIRTTPPPDSGLVVRRLTRVAPCAVLRAELPGRSIRRRGTWRISAHHNCLQFTLLPLRR